VPEGDTIHRAARRLADALAGRPALRIETPRSHGPVRPPEEGTVISSVEARGKHLLVRFADGRTLRTHMRMNGSWHLYAAGERWRRPAHQMRALIEVDGWQAVCFLAPEVEWLRGGRGTTDGVKGRLAHLGPDLCRADADIDRAVELMGSVPDPRTEIGVALLDQRVACGVGNVYKNEVLYACEVNPFTPVGELDVVDRRRLIGTASRLLRANLGSGPRRTAPGGVAVYGRTGRPCRRCGTIIRSRRQGEQARTTYWCPTCQPAPAATAETAATAASR
jgi:endonuclease-8